MNANKSIGAKSANAIASGYKSTKNSVASTYSSFNGLSMLARVFMIILFISLVVLLIMWLWNLRSISIFNAKQSPYIITSPRNAFNKNRNPVATKNVPSPTNGLEFSYSLWIYIADWNYRFGERKNIFSKGSSAFGGSFSPILSLGETKNSLFASIAGHTNSSVYECNINNIPLQKWIHIGYILNNRTVDIYIDGKLERSCVLRGVPKLNDAPVNVATDGGFYGQIAKMQYFTRALMPTEIAEIYSEGPYISSLSSWFSSELEDNSGDSGNCPGPSSWSNFSNSLQQQVSSAYQGAQQKATDGLQAVETQFGNTASQDNQN